MRFARCTLDNQNYDAEAFRGLANFQVLNEAMVCPECGGRARYRGTGSDGRIACFVGRPHRDDCTIRTNNTATPHTEQNEPVPPEDQVLVVNLNNITPQAGSDNQPTGGIAGRNHGADNVERQQANPVRHFSMRRLLARLMMVDNFIGWPAMTVVPGFGRYETTTLFMDLLNATTDNVGEFHGYWGSIPDIQVILNSLWMNSGMSEHMSVLLDDQLAEEFYQRYPVEEDMSELEGAHILVFGTLLQARSSGKLYVQVTDLNHFSLIQQGRV